MAAPAFDLPTALEAHEPPEIRGVARDEVRLMVATRSDGHIEHARFRDLPSHLDAGDLLVVNVSATMPAAIGARRARGERVDVHVATPAPHVSGGEWWVVEVRGDGGASPYAGIVQGERLDLDGGGALEVVTPYAGGVRLWLARALTEDPLTTHLARHGHPIRYGYVPRPWPLAAYQTAFALQPGSAEMPSAARPFTPELVTRLVSEGVLFAPVVLHTGVSSPERHETPYPEPYAVPATTARLINAVRGWGGRVVAVGTTVVRALESVAEPDGTVGAGAGWTGLVVTPERGLRAVDGLLSGWHEPAASHLQLLEAAAGDALLRRCYDEALAKGYLWHEFGDSHLILP